MLLVKIKKIQDGEIAVLIHSYYNLREYAEREALPYEPEALFHELIFRMIKKGVDVNTTHPLGTAIYRR